MVLLVEDNPDHALLVRIAMAKVAPGVDVRTANDGVEAVAYLDGQGSFADRAAHPFPDLVLLDLKMPRLDGFGVLQWLQARDGLRKLTVAVLTSSVSPDDEARALGLGASAFVSKAADLDRLGDQLRDVLARCPS